MWAPTLTKPLGRCVLYKRMRSKSRDQWPLFRVGIFGQDGCVLLAVPMILLPSHDLITKMRLVACWIDIHLENCINSEDTDQNGCYRCRKGKREGI